MTQIPGISEVTALAFLAEVGLDWSLWKSAKHFAAWLNWVPNVQQSGAHSPSANDAEAKQSGATFKDVRSNPRQQQIAVRRFLAPNEEQTRSKRHRRCDRT